MSYPTKPLTFQSLLAYKPDSPLTLLVAILPIIALIFAFYRLKLHPLSKFPGPKLWAISRLPSAYHTLRGTLHYRLAELFDEYGHVVRTAPGELAFAHEDTWNDAYMKYNGKQFARDPATMPDAPDDGEQGIVFAMDENDHARMRRVLAPSFSELSLKKQEPIINSYLDLLIQQLHNNAGKSIDIWYWFKLAVFDITGDLTYGESFECLKSSKEHEWITTSFFFIKALTFHVLAARFSPLHKLLDLLIPKSVAQKVVDHRAFTNAKLDRRLAIKDGRSDFLSLAQATLNTSKGMTLGELRETSGILILAGAETTATSLAGIFRLLLIHPSKLEALKTQIRTAFTSEQDITIQHIRERLPYQLAIINEGLRLFNPLPVALSLNRIVPDEGSVIAGRHVPGKTIVAVAPWAAFRSKRNFADPEAFVPERWLEGKECPERYRDDKRRVVQAFGAGPRGCIGKTLAYAEMGLILARVLWNFDLELCDNKPWGPERKSEVWTVWEHQPLMVRVTPAKR